MYDGLPSRSAEVDQRTGKSVVPIDASRPARLLLGTFPLSQNFPSSPLAEWFAWPIMIITQGATWNRPDELKILVACRG